MFSASYTSLNALRCALVPFCHAQPLLVSMQARSASWFATHISIINGHLTAPFREKVLDVVLKTFSNCPS